MSQSSIVKQQLKNRGEVSRNWCIRENYITRLGAIIDALKKKGWEFETLKREGDYVYRLIKDPTQFDENVYCESEIKRRKESHYHRKLF